MRRIKSGADSSHLSVHQCLIWPKLNTATTGSLLEIGLGRISLDVDIPPHLSLIFRSVKVSTRQDSYHILVMLSMVKVPFL